ncbi:MAG: tyrosine-type recombinase/integrase, partial [Bacteroidota bacterium]
MNEFKNYLDGRGYRLNTIYGYVNNTKLFLQWCKKNKINPINVSYNEILRYLESIQQKTSNKRTQRHKMQSVKMYYNYLIQKSETDSNPVKELRIKNTVKTLPHNILSYEVLQKIYEQSATTGAGITAKRNRVMIGLMIFQGLNTGELAKLEVNDIKIHEGKIYIPAIGRSNSRVLKLEAQQIIDLQNYIKQERPLLLSLRKKRTDKLLVSTGGGNLLGNAATALLKEIRKTHPQVKNIKQVRASVIQYWLK